MAATMSFTALHSPISATLSLTEGLRSLRASNSNVADVVPLSTVVDAASAYSPHESAIEDDPELKLPKIPSLISMLVLNGMSHVGLPFCVHKLDAALTFQCFPRSSCRRSSSSHPRATTRKHWEVTLYLPVSSSASHLCSLASRYRALWQLTRVHISRSENLTRWPTEFRIGTYMGPIVFACILATIGNVLYGLAYVGTLRTIAGTSRANIFR